MKWFCFTCKKTFSRDMRIKENRYFLTKTGLYRSSCRNGHKSLCRKVK